MQNFILTSLSSWTDWFDSYSDARKTISREMALMYLTTLPEDPVSRRQVYGMKS